MKTTIIATALINLHVLCSCRPVDETAINHQSPAVKSLPVELPPFDVPMQETTYGWQKLHPQIDTTGRQGSNVVSSLNTRLNHMSGNKIVFGTYEKGWPTHNELFDRHNERPEILMSDVVSNDEIVVTTTVTPEVSE